MKKNIYAVYFSPTYTSKKNAISIAKEFSDDVTEVDMTIMAKKPKVTEFKENDVVVFGGPVYGGRLYKGFVERLKTLKGNKTPCVIIVTYGNRDFDDALLEMKDIAESNGFVPFAGAAVLGEHTFGEVAVGRPDADDLKKNSEFAKKAVVKLQKGDFALEVIGNRPYKDGGTGGGFRPLTDKNLCSNCGWCYENCPEGAISKEDFSVIDDSKCISCFRCIKNCPSGAKNMDTPDYNNFAVGFTKKLSAKCENKYFL